ncbi:hypothetical protein ACFRAU_14285 [Arthrobacter sp. NPDC056691]|uniref:hypothetical protein n=1 Tax=Arthrobacter sp. NPDC056691 TaxID=3345913 RepID=UPI00366BC3A2
MKSHRYDEWNLLIGAFVEIRKDQRFVRAGFVEDAMPDSSSLWLAASGTYTRTLLEKSEGYEVWVEPQELEGPLRYRMTASKLHDDQMTHSGV